MSDICYADIHEIHRLYQNKRLTVRELVTAYLTRIAKIDKCANGLNSVLEINPDALFIAESLDAQLRRGAEMTPLFGIPILLKDNINTNDRLHTSAGSVALADNYAPYDAHIAGLLRRAGAVILGKANMTEFANYMAYDKMPSGYSSRGGQVINPHNREVTPSGSSSGSAVAVAAGLCTVSIGTETSGSIVSPAGYNGIVGIKPTLGLVGRSGIIPISSMFDTAGPMARTVRDAAILLGAISGADPSDPATHCLYGAPSAACPTPSDCCPSTSAACPTPPDCCPSPSTACPTPPAFPTPSAACSSPSADYEACLDPDGLKGARIGLNNSFRYGEVELKGDAKEAYDNLLQTLSDAGAVLVENVDMETKYEMGDVMHSEFKACMNYYLSTLGKRSKLKTLGDIIAYNQANAPTALKYGQSVLLDAQNTKSGNLTEPKYLEALADRERTIAELDRLFDDNKIDVLLCQSISNVAPFTGFPSMTIPTGLRKDKLPTDSYWIARRFDEATLLKITYAAEQRLGLQLRPELPL